jgi:hypothetical protein
VSNTRCPCSRPITYNAILCTNCGSRLEQALAELPSLLDDLEVTRTRQNRAGGANTGVLSRSYERPLPWSENASEAVEVIRLTLFGWCQILAAERDSYPTFNTPTSMSVHLLANINWLRHHEAADAALDEIIHATEYGTSKIDNPPTMLYAGPCDPDGQWHTNDLGAGGLWVLELQGPCSTDLYAHEGKRDVTCPRCQLVWKVEDRRDQMLEQAEDQLVTAADLSRFLSAYGEPLTADRIYQWVKRGHLAAHGHTATGRPLYRVGDATDVLTRISETRRKAS